MNDALLLRGGRAAGAASGAVPTLENSLSLRQHLSRFLQGFLFRWEVGVRVSCVLGQMC